jgi:hypothetical protein
MKPKRVWRDLEISEVSLVSAGANQPAFVTLFKSRKGEPMKKAQTCRVCETAVDQEDQYCRKCGAPFYKGETQVDENQKIEKALADAKAEMQKAFDAERAKLAKEAEERESALKAEVAKQQAEIAKQQRIEKRRDAVARIDKAMKSVPAPSEELADKLVEAEEKAPEIAKYFEEILVKCSAALAESALLKQKGDSTDPAGSDDVLSLVDKKVAEKLAANPKMNKHQAEAEVWRENRDLYAKYIAAQPAE